MSTNAFANIKDAGDSEVPPLSYLNIRITLESGQVNSGSVTVGPARAEEAVSPFRSYHSADLLQDVSLHEGENRGHVVSVDAGIEGVRQPLTRQTVGV